MSWDRPTKANWRFARCSIPPTAPRRAGSTDPDHRRLALGDGDGTPESRRHRSTANRANAIFPETLMKYICLGYIEPTQFESMPDHERNAMIDECLAYDDILRKNGHFLGGEGLQGAHTATTLRWRNGSVAITDGPYAETKEQIGGILLLEARDLNHAIQL